MVDQVVRAATAEEIARVEARNAMQEAEAAKGKPRFVGGKEREITIQLEFPMEYDGKTYEAVTIRRPVMAEWRAYLRACAEAVKERGPGADDLVDQSWLSIPAVVLEALDFSDAARVEAAQEGFFGRSSLPETEETGQQA